MSDAMETIPTAPENPPTRSTARRDDAPKGVFHRTPKLWATRFVCGQGHTHEETIGALKGDAVRAHQARLREHVAVHCKPRTRELLGRSSLAMFTPLLAIWRWRA